MRHFATVVFRPLNSHTPISPISRHVRVVCTHLPLSRTPQRHFSQSTRRAAADSLSFKKYSLPPQKKKKMNGTDTSKLPAKRTAYIALGSNMGDRIAWIEKACNEMDARGIKVKRTSSLWETEPMYVLDQDRFVNGACEVETTLEPLALLDALQEVENALGRKKVIDKGPRNIDLDILLYENLKIDHERLKVPHIGIPEREFVLRPLAELIPDKPIDHARPWTLTRDLLDKLPPSDPPLTTMTPLSAHHPPIQALKPDRKTHVMAILNMTPDSFSDGGQLPELDPPSFLAKVQSLLDAGATMIDIGGQSTAPRAPEVSTEEELSRVVPAIQLIRTHFTQPALISVDTYRARVAEAAVAAGADIVNDVSGGSVDPDMLPTVARLGTTVCLMHMRGTPATMSSLADYPPSEGGLIVGIARELVSRVEAAEAAGIRRWRIVLDPGLGFAKIGMQNVDVLRNLELLRHWPGLQGLPWLVGSSRKSFIGQVTGVPTPKERIWGTAATVAAAVQGGADVVRVHDVKEMAQVVSMADAIWRY
ncbi:Dihydropteroate synthase-like protein [Immersiella caudata]|uniref:Folic acid synthesis protein FOL1 n=1 Tax=Immersiella caudata TaxID=314043 RepID=A0AA39X546_9PEZI|nr:Dihydropteroate synthase-like protein [Immersiella caudata]